jgi:hypothetical protein
LDSLVAFALRAVFGVVGDLVSPAWAIVAVATRVSPEDLMLAAIFDDVACAHVAGQLSALRWKPSIRSSGSFADRSNEEMYDERLWWRSHAKKDTFLLFP